MSADLIAMQVRLVLKGNVDYLHGGWQTLLDGLAGAVRRGVERPPPRPGRWCPTAGGCG